MKKAQEVIFFLTICLFMLGSCNDDGNDGSSGNSSVFQSGNEIYQTFQYQDWNGRATPGWVVPSNVTAGLFEVSILSTLAVAGPVNIEISDATSSPAPTPLLQITPLKDQTITRYFIAPVMSGSTIYAWHTSDYSGCLNLIDITVKVRNIGWLQ